MDTHAVLGPGDPPWGEYPTVSILKVVGRKKVDEIDDRTLILADIAEKVRHQVYIQVREILISNKMEAEKADPLAQILTEGRWIHDDPISYEEAVELGLPVQDSLPEEVLILMS
jgi:ClpP class serine protease